MSGKNTAHTAGPWKAIKPECERRKGVFASVCTNGATISTREFEIMADGYQNSHAEANARLIAAAPDLLQALEDAKSMLETASRYFPKSIKNGDRFSLLNTLANSVNPALAKAKGGAL